jgi:hypothetical protein
LILSIVIAPVLITSLVISVITTYFVNLGKNNKKNNNDS